MKKIIHTPDAPPAIGPSSPAPLVNGTLYISGPIPVDPENGKQVENIQKETHQVMKNLKAILKAADMDFSNAVKASIFLINMDDFAEVNEIYASYFENEIYPARETVQVSCLPKNVDVEISMIAFKD